jgi:CHAT domain-containing protein/Flp pilus assembly protein TadD
VIAVLSAVLELSALTAVVQAAPQSSRLIELAESASHEELVAETRTRPEEARRAFRDLLRDSPEAPDPAAGRLASAYAEAWTDPFLVNRYDQFVAWSVPERRVKLTADSLRRAGNEAYTSEGAEEALRLWRLSLSEAEGLPDTVGIARSLGNIGAGHYAAGRSDSAVFYYRRSQELALATGDFVTAANALDVQASLRRESGDLAEASSLYRRALDMHERVGAVRAAGFDHHNLGLLALSLGDVEGARREFEAAIAISRRTGRRDDEADHLSSLADALMAGGDYAGADTLLARALELDREVGNRWGEAGVLHSLGLLAMARGDYAAAVRELEQAQSLYADLDRIPEAISVQADLGRARAAAGDLRGGMADLRDALRIADTAEVNAQVRARLSLAAGDLELALNDYEQARRDYAEAERLYQRMEDYGGIAAARHGLAFVHLYQEELEEAEAELQRALVAQQELGDPRSGALTRLLLAEVLLEGSDLEQSRTVASAARDVLLALPDPVGEATALLTLGEVDLQAALHREAEDLFTQGLAALASADAPDIAWRLHAGRAEALEALGRVDEARSALESAIAEIERTASGWAYLASSSGYLADKWEVYAHLATLQLESGAAEAAFETSERLRAQRMLAILDRGRVQAREPAGELASREQDLRRQIADLSDRVESASPWDKELRGVSTGAQTREQAALALEEARRAYSRVLEELRESNAPYAELVRPEIPSWKAIARALTDDEVFLEYLISDTTALVFGVSTDGISAVRLDADGATLRDLIGFTRGVLEDPEHGGESELWRMPLERLRGILIDPVEAAGWLEGRRHLTIAAHGSLHYLPFPALVGPDGRFLIERFTVETTPSAAVWQRLAARPTRVRGGGALAMAPRTFDLPGTRREVDRVRTAYAGQADLLLGTEATEDAFMSAAGTYDVIHLATYGVANRTNPLFSFVELAPGPRSDGRLEAHELSGLELDADLVVLSACETGFGSGIRADVPAGDDWESLVRSFLAAGAAEVLASLWRVEDQATADLMEAFYVAYADGVSARDALASAQQRLLAEPRTASPFYWAGFVLTGGSGGGE